MTPFLWRIARRLRRYGNGFRTKRSLRALGLAEDERARALGLALQHARPGLEEPDEGAWFQRIEAIREKMSRSTTIIEDVDYGSGAPSDTPTDEEMAAGRDDTITLGNQTRLSSLPPVWCRVLFHLIRAHRPTSCLELGTSVGISALYQAAALSINGSGTLITLEGAAKIADRAKKNARASGLANVEVVVGRFLDTLDDVLARTKPIDWAFVDGHHDERATVDYCSRIIPAMSPDGILVLDDITWSDGMLHAWHEVSRRDDVAFAVDLHQIGVIGLGRTEGKAFRRRVRLKER